MDDLLDLSIDLSALPPAEPAPEVVAAPEAEAAPAAVVQIFAPPAEDAPAETPPPLADFTPQEPAAAIEDNPSTISVDRILAERQDVLNAYFQGWFKTQGHEHLRDEWVGKVGGSTPEAYARYWYDNHGRFDGYSQGQITAAENISLDQLVRDRPDVVEAYVRDFQANHHHGKPEPVWTSKVGGEGLHDYARYWFNNHGRYEGYNQRPPAPAVADEPEAAPFDPNPPEPPVIDPAAEVPADAAAVTPPLADDPIQLVGYAPPEPELV